MIPRPLLAALLFAGAIAMLPAQRGPQNSTEAPHSPDATAAPTNAPSDAPDSEGQNAGVNALISRETVPNRHEKFDYPGVPALTWDEPNIPPLEQLAVVHDPLSQLTRADVEERLMRGEFTLVQQGGLNNYGSVPGKLWLAFVIRNPSEKGTRTMLEINGMAPQTINFYQIRVRNEKITTWIREVHGSRVPFAQRPLPVAPLVIEATVPPFLDSLTMLEVASPGPKVLNIQLLNSPNFFSNMENSIFYVSFFIGILLTLMLYNGFLYVAVRDKVYLWFILHLFLITMFTVATSGLGYKFLWPDFPNFQVISAQLFRTLFILATGLFLRIMLNIKERFPRLNRVFLVLLLISLITVVVPMFFGERANLINLAIVSQFLMVILAIMASTRRQDFSILFVIGWSLVTLGTLCWLLAIYLVDIPPQVTFVLFNAAQPCILVEAILFSFGLSRRLQKLKREKDEAVAKNRIKQSFIANVSHEMRTPLNVIVGFSEAIRDARNLDDVKQYNASIIEESDRLLFQINQVLDIAKIEADRLELESTPFCLSESLDYLYRSNHAKAQRKHLELIFTIPPECPEMVLGDRLRLEQILRNLLDNAIKFTDRGNVHLCLECTAVNSKVMRVNFRISDTGIGIPEQALGDIFEDFKQVDSSITRRFGGTGLGTSISQRLVRAMGGEITVTSILGKGSTFSFSIEFTLPEGYTTECCTAAAQELNKTLPDRQQVPQAQAQSRRILVVDDFDSNRQVVRIHLAKTAWEVDCAESGEKAIEMIQAQQYDLVLLDIFMPGMSGYDVIRWIRSNPATSNLKVLGLTASGYEQDIHDAMSAGMDGVLVKPVKRGSLIEAIEEHLLR